MGAPCATRTSTTSHGGTPVSSATKERAGGQLMLRIGDQIACPVSGHGTTTVTSGSGTVKAEGIGVAFDGCSTSCGATLTGGITSVRVG